jgi:tRNA-splicing ligase RtcB
LQRRARPIPFSEAITPANTEEEKNVEKVRKQMHALLCIPILAAGVILPDACPVSPQEAVIPVGAAVVAENVIIPSAHSADICCSMWATFYDKRSSLVSELDDLTSATNFGSIPRTY